MHVKGCDLVTKDNFFGPALRANLLGCPIPPGEHWLTNMSIPDLPLLRTFPFRKGRIYANATTVPGGVLVFTGYVDMEIKLRSSSRRVESKPTERGELGTRLANEYVRSLARPDQDCPPAAEPRCSSPPASTSSDQAPQDCRDLTDV
ncbi:uncharacterized protein LOC134792302 [Cydia splendana]|uniref:uncharacterized protein LOC134792302 n=1 Tax=Cydia splendana TaxID=1100963 RepID=UPI00300D7165